ncbi:MAG: hypothetical protein RQ741_08125 [Wenzhouxiangellaceae bacterium]|nr:hypothetical protein [Wenzhouxiangellaceae bacterium]
MTAGFARLQKSENELIPRLVAEAGADWMLELAPAASPSPTLDVPRHRMLHNGEGWIWPCRLETGLLPFADGDLPGILLRHLFWLESSDALLDEAMRCLKPGGLLVSVSANPWHRISWQELGRDAFQLPAWPRFLMLHARHRLMMQIPARQHWSGVVPGVSPILVVVARKPPRAISVRKLKFRRRPMTGRAASAGSSCRAA